MRSLIIAVVSAAAVAVMLPGGPAAAAPSAGCVGLGGTDSAHQCHVTTSAQTYTIDLTYPEDYPDQQALVDYLTQTRDGFLSIVNDSPARDRVYELQATAEQHRSGQAADGTRSVVLKLFEEVGGAHPSTWYKAFNYNLATNRPITFATMFASDANALDAIFPVVQRELGDELALGSTILPGAGQDPAHYQNFAITDDQVIFYFGQGELLPSSAGPTEVKVARSAIPPLVLS